jgi:glycosyltransferase involved in cell wall biosynthesis
MKKVLAIAPYSYLPYFSGGQKFISKFFEHLSKETDLTVVSVAENQKDLAPYKILPLLKRSFSRYYDRSLVSKLTQLIHEEKFDVIIWEHPYYSWLANKIRKNTGIRTIIHTHNIEYQRFKSLGKCWWPILRRYEKNCLQKADAIFFITPEDRDFAIQSWKIANEKTALVPFGIDNDQFPVDRQSVSEKIRQKFGIGPNEKIILFNGLLSYLPNLDALNVILDIINPILLKTDIKYKIIVCGKGLPADMNSLLTYSDKNILFAGFVDDIESYFKAADIFLNPVQKGGGIKTKMVEAIGYGCTVISTATGATGMNRDVCNDKLIVVRDNDWTSFTEKIKEVANSRETITPPAYYREYGWKHIIQKVLPFLTA